MKLRSVREVLAGGYFLYLCGTIGFATIQPGQNANIIAFAAMTGLGAGSVLAQVVTIAQISQPHSYLATATAVAMTTRAMAASVATSIYSAVVSDKLGTKVPRYIIKAATSIGVPTKSISAFVSAIASGTVGQAAEIPGVSQSMISAGIIARQHAYADSIRYCFLIEIPFLVIGVVSSCFIGSIKNLMNYHVHAPVEKLQPKALNEKVAVSA